MHIMAYVTPSLFAHLQSSSHTLACAAPDMTTNLDFRHHTHDVQSAFIWIQQHSLISKLCLLTLHFPRLRIIWSRSLHATADIFRALKTNQEEPDPVAAAAVGEGQLLMTCLHCILCYPVLTLSTLCGLSLSQVSIVCDTAAACKALREA